MILQATFAEENTSFRADFDSGGSFDADFGEIHEIVKTDMPVYNGPYVVSPGKEVQLLHTAGHALMDDITVEKIPEKYGLITYDQDKTITIT